MIDMNDPEVIESLKYLLVPKEEKIRTSALPFDAKKNFFIPHKTEGYLTAVITKEDGDNVTVVVDKDQSTVTLKREQLLQMNPMKYEKCDDMADLTYLNDATVYHNLRTRYEAWYIYTYSGLFCVTINPFKRLPLYTMKMVHFYRGKKKNEVPPHLYLVADNAYAAMTRDKANQSMLITGESGAGKTENTKKVIQYFAFVAAGVGKKKVVEDPNKPSLEDQIVSANPVLEAYGNAKTTRNNNSSRFGKFIRVHFTNIFAIAGADIESYLLEKSRITYCMELERNYHIFYQLCSGAFPELNKEILLEADPSKYFFINQGMLTIDRVDDVQEMKDTKTAFDILMFTQEQQMDLFKLTSGVANWGNTKWKQRPREEQAEPDGTEELEIVAKLFGLDADEMIKGITKPRIKVGNEYVNKGQNKDQCTNSVGALSKAAFSRAFAWLVEVVNVTLDVKELKRAHFIGVLDIAGFETFEYNGFEQICINFTNERLQQFFNNFMFVLEQAEYTKEGIEWKTESFGADLQATIDLIEKKMGIFAILEEECIVPKATDMTFKDKLYKQHLGKHASFGKPKPKKGSKFEAHFDLHHYAGVVSYSVDGWLEKNKDPINMTVATLFKKSTGNNLLAYLFRDVGEEEAGGGKKKGGGSANTISSGHREQLNKLMKTLDATHPHFVRCIIPNELKTGGILDAHLVLHQLHCNGVLEGIRICRKGYPSRMIFLDFLQRYGILSASASKSTSDLKKASAAVLTAIGLDTESYRVGLTKVLFKAGVLGTLEEMRDEIIVRILTLLQSQLRRFLIKKNIKKMIEQKKALAIVQRNVKAYIDLRNWGWLKLYNAMKHLLVSAKKAEEERLRKEQEEKERIERERLEKIENERRAAQAAQLEEQNVKLLEEKNKLTTELTNLREVAGNAETMISKLNSQKADLESNLNTLEDRLLQEESEKSDLQGKKKKLESELADMKSTNSDVHTKLQKTEAEVQAKENHVKKLQDEMAALDDTIARLNKAKKQLEAANNDSQMQVQEHEDKISHLNSVKSKLEQALDESEDNCEKEKKAKADLDKIKRKVENDLKAAQAAMEEVERSKAELQDALKHKDSELKNSIDKAEDNFLQFTTSQRKVKELQARLAEAEEEVDAERALKAKAEKQRSELTHELDELTERLEEAGGASNAQLELNRRRESELNKLRLDLEEANVQHEITAAQLRKKHQDAVAEMADQIDQLTKSKSRVEKEKTSIKSQLDEAKSQTEQALRAKQLSDKSTKQMEMSFNEANIRIESLNTTIIELNSSISRMRNENSSLLSQLEDSQVQIDGIARIKSQYQNQVDEAKRSAEEESRARHSLSQHLKNMTIDFESVKNQFEEEVANQSDLKNRFSKASAEAMLWKSKYESDSLLRAEELEEAKRKLAMKLTEAEEQVEQALIKCASLEKSKNRLQCDMEDLMVDVEKANSNALSMEKKQRQFDKLIEEWKMKCEGITIELDVSQREARQYSAEVFKVKSQYDECQESMESIRRENKNLAEEIKDLMTQLSDDGRNVHELEKTKRRLEQEKEELQMALEEAEGALEQQESKITLVHLELTNVRQEIDRRLHEKEEEFDNTRRNHERAVESMQASLDAEIKGRAEANRQKKKLELDINELEIALDHANRMNGENSKTISRLTISITELESTIEDERRKYVEQREAVNSAERRANALLSEIEEMRTTVEQSDRARKSAENDLHDAADHISEVNTSNANLTAQKRKIENDLSAMQVDLDEALGELKFSEERVRKATSDSARLAEELRQEQEHSLNCEKMRKALELHVKDLQERLDQAEANALKGGKRIIQKMEQRIHDLETELETEQRHHNDTMKEIKRNNRRLKDLAMQSEDDKKSMVRLQELNDQLNTKVKAYRRQCEEVEEVAALNLCKFRKVQQEFEDAAERADQAENNVLKLRTKNRSTQSMGRLSPQRETTQHSRASVRTSSVRRVVIEEM